MTLRELLLRLQEIEKKNDEKFYGRMGISVNRGIVGIEFEESSEGHHFYGTAFKDNSAVLDMETHATEEGLVNACKRWGYKP